MQPLLGSGLAFRLPSSSADGASWLCCGSPSSSWQLSQPQQSFLRACPFLGTCIPGSSWKLLPLRLVTAHMFYSS